MRKFVLAGLIGAMMMTTSTAAAPLPASARAGPPPAPPLIIAHRGASADRPEHTIAAYTKAIEDGADFIEPDLVATKDHHLIARHENEISTTTNVKDHPEFADRKRTQIIDGATYTGWFTEDFTLAELKTLRARERIPLLRPDNAKYDDQFALATLAEIIALAKAETLRTGRPIGIYPETKHPSHFAKIGLPLEPKLLEALSAAGWTKATDPVFIQSFEVENLKAMRILTNIRLVQLIDTGTSADGHDYAQMLTPEGLATIKTYANAIGPSRDLIYPRTTLGKLQPPTNLVEDAHTAGLDVHPWTFRPENYFLAAPYRSSLNPRARGNAAEEIRLYVEAGIDALFTDSPADATTAIAAPH